MNNGLPVGAQDSNCWLHMVVPTMVWYLSIQDDPWTISDEDLRDTLQQVWDGVYKKTIRHTVINDTVFALVSTPTPPTRSVNNTETDLWPVFTMFV